MAKKIALFISSLQKGGSERVIVNLAEDFFQKGYEVVLVTQYKQKVEYEINPEIRRVYSEPSAELLRGSRVHNFITRFRMLRKIWKIEKPDVILAFLGKNNLMAIATSRFLPVRVIASVRGEPTMEYEGKKMQSIAKLVFRFADGVVFQTTPARAFFPKSVQKKSVILPNPLNPMFLNHSIAKEKNDIIVAVGRLDENKNHAMLIDGFEKIAAEYPKMKLVIYGEGEIRPKLENMVLEKGLQERVLLPGNITDIPDKLCKARIFALTSNTEGMPNTIIEAFALGIPVVATDCPCGGPAELIQNGENGILIPVGDSNALADAMRKILSDDAFAKKLGEHAFETSKLYEPARVNKAWEEFLFLNENK